MKWGTTSWTNSISIYVQEVLSIYQFRTFRSHVCMSRNSCPILTVNSLLIYTYIYKWTIIIELNVYFIIAKKYTYGTKHM